jgi:hypothetical protein
LVLTDDPKTIVLGSSAAHTIVAADLLPAGVTLAISQEPSAEAVESIDVVITGDD